METVLLAIEGEKPHRSVVSFAVQFCRRMHVALDIVHVIEPGQDVPTASDYCRNVAGDSGEEPAFECSDTHLLKSENPPKAIAHYIDTHRNIVLAIYDSRTGTLKTSNETPTREQLPVGFEKPLAVPLVVMRAI